MDVLQRIKEYAFRNPDKTAFICGADFEKMTYGEFEEKASILAHYLISKEIGKEDVVMYCLPRGFSTLIAMYGTMKAGAAYVLVNASDPVEKKERIMNDTGCLLALDEAMLQTVLSGKAGVFNDHSGSSLKQQKTADASAGLSERKADSHDLCYILYTSGSTGKPKGIMMEYGSLETAYRAAEIQGERMFTEDTVLCDFAPQTIATMHDFFSSVLPVGGTIAFPPFEYIFAPEKMRDFLEKSGAETAYFTPSLYRALKPFPASVKRVILAGEPAAGDFDEGHKVLSFYGCSESGSFLMTGKCRKHEDFPVLGSIVVPGRTGFYDESGKPVSDGECGEFCYENPYFRAYTVSSEFEKAEFYGLFRSGDLVRHDSDGRFIFSGRVNDSFKLKGDFVPQETVAAPLRKALGVDKVIVKLFTVGSRDILTAFYFEEILFDAEAVKRALREVLPDPDLVPEAFICVEKPALLPSGKIDRSKLLYP